MISDARGFDPTLVTVNAGDNVLLERGRGRSVRELVTSDDSPREDCSTLAP